MTFRLRGATGTARSVVGGSGRLYRRRLAFHRDLQPRPWHFALFAVFTPIFLLISASGTQVQAIRAVGFRKWAVTISFRQVVPQVREWVTELRAALRKYRREAAERRRDNASAVALAADPAASPERIAALVARMRADLVGHLAGRPSRILLALAAHPNTPPECLLALLEEDTDKAMPWLFANPILPLLPLECPDFITRLASITLELLLVRPDLPAPLARLLACHPDPMVAWEAAAHIALLGEGKPTDDVALTARLRQFVEKETDHHPRCLYALVAELKQGPDWLADAVAVNARTHGDPLENPPFFRDWPEVPDTIIEAALCCYPEYLSTALWFSFQGVFAPEHPHNIVSEWLGGLYVAMQEVLSPLHSSSVRYAPHPGDKELKKRYYALLWSLTRRRETSPALLGSVLGPEEMEMQHWFMLAALRHPNADTALVQQCRDQLEGTLSWNMGCGCSASQIARYLYLSSQPTLPQEFAMTTLRDGDFLARRLCAERNIHSRRLADRRLRRALADDPNRFVRAALETRAS